MTTPEDKITFSVSAQQSEPDSLTIEVKVIRQASVESVSCVEAISVPPAPQNSQPVIGLQMVSISQQELEELNKYKTDVKRIMNDFGIESDEDAYEIVVRTTAAAVKLRADFDALSAKNLDLENRLQQAILMINKTMAERDAAHKKAERFAMAESAAVNAEIAASSEATNLRQENDRLTNAMYRLTSSEWWEKKLNEHVAVIDRDGLAATIAVLAQHAKM